MIQNMLDRLLKQRLISAAVALALVPSAQATARFGTMCQESYQHGWQSTRSYSYFNCGGFNDELNDTDTQAFYYNLEGDNPNLAWEEGADQFVAETVDLLYSETHGGTRSGCNYGYLDSVTPKPKAEKLSQDVLEKRGRDFIANYLYSFIQLGVGESIEPFFTRYELGGGASETAPGTEAILNEKIHSNTVVFTRVVDKSVVVGSDSKIAIIFASDGKPIGFDFDWPVYKVSSKFQSTVNVSEVRSRLVKVANRDLDTPGWNMKRFECGLFDSGARNYDSNSYVQVACFVMSIFEGPKENGIQAAISTAIPAGQSIEPDFYWRAPCKGGAFPVGASPTRQPLQPEATGATMEVTK